MAGIRRIFSIQAKRFWRPFDALKQSKKIPSDVKKPPIFQKEQDLASPKIQKAIKIFNESESFEDFKKKIIKHFPEADAYEMAAFLKNFASGITDMVNVAQAKISPFTVQATTPEKLSGCNIIKQDGCLTLYRKSSSMTTLECTVTRPDIPSKMLSVFRHTAETDADVLYKSLVIMMAPIVASCTVPFQEENIQKILDCIREHPNWTCAHVAGYLGLYNSLKCPGIIDFMDHPCKTHKMTPLMAAITGKQALAAEELLRLGAKLGTKDKNGDTPYHYAVVNCPAIVALLVDYDKEGVINWLNGKGESALLMACQRKLSDATEILVGSGADPRIATADCLPIHAAVKSGDLKSIEAIIQAYPDQANAKDYKYGGTPLHWAESVDVIQKLAFLKCDMNILNNEGNAPIHVMMKKKRFECLMSLLCYGADCNVLDPEGESVLHKAIKGNDLDLVRQFVVFGADVNQLTKDGLSPRHLASISKGKNRDKILYLLHLSGANRCCKEGKGCLSGCVAEGNYTGVPDKTMAALMKLDDVALFDEQLMATVVSNVRTPQQQGAVIDMEDGPVSPGDRILCLDGGGIRGLVLIQILMEIEAAVGKPINDCFDWIGGTSTGGILALGIARGFSLQYMKGLYVRLKDEVFKGSRPYDCTPFEEMLRREFGEDVCMAEIKHPKVMVTAVLADRYPAELHLFRNYEQTLHHPTSSASKDGIETKKPCEQKLWEAARSSGAAPTYFRGFGPFLDGGLIANNPTLDVLTEIHEYSLGLKMLNRADEVNSIGCVISLGCGRIPCLEVQNADVFLPSGLYDVYKAVSGATALGRLMVDQATTSEGRPVDRARAWCSMINVPYYRFSPLLSEDVALDCHDTKVLINMMWETHCYMVANRHRLKEIASLLRSGNSKQENRDDKNS